MHNAHIHYWFLIWLFVPLLCRSRTNVCTCVRVRLRLRLHLHLQLRLMCLSLSLHRHRHLVSVRVCCFIYSSAGHFLYIQECAYLSIYPSIYLSIYLSIYWLIHLFYILMLYYTCLHLFMHKMPAAPRSCSAHSLSLTLWTHSSEGLLWHFSQSHRWVKPPRIPSWILSAGFQPQLSAKAKPPWHIFSPRSNGRLHVVKATPQQPLTGMAF